MMARKLESETTPPARAMGDQSPWPAEVAGALAQAERLLEEGGPDKALELLGRAGKGSPWIINAIGTCQLRLGNALRALEIYRGLVLGASGVVLRDDVPPVFKVNYAASLLASGNLDGCLRVLNELGNESLPGVKTIRGVIQRWREGQTFWQKVWPLLGGQAPPVPIDVPLGDLR